MKTLSFILLISLALSTAFAQSNLRKENQVRLTEETDPDYVAEEVVIEPQLYMDPEEMFRYVKNGYNHYDGLCAYPDVFTGFLQEYFKTFREMPFNTVVKMIQKYDKNRQSCLDYNEFYQFYQDFHLGD